MNSRPIVTLVAAAFLQLSAPVQADEAVGSYLAARQALYESDFATAAQYFTRALAEDPSNPQILESTVIARLSLGQIDKALPVARLIEAEGLGSQVARMVLAAGEARTGAYGQIIARVDEDRGVGLLVDGLMAAWAHIGDGEMSKALERFDTVAAERGLQSFASYHKALALASVGDFESADEIYMASEAGPLQRTRRGALAQIEVLSQLERNAEAIAVLDDTFGTELDPGLQQMRAALVAGDRLPFTLIRNTQDGIAEVFYTVGSALTAEAGDDFVLLYSRVAEYVRPDHIDAILLSAQMLEGLGRYELATETYKRVPRDDPNFHAAEMGRAEALRRQDKMSAAIEVLEQLSKTHAELGSVHVTLGDYFRETDDFANAVAAYDRALELYEEGDRNRWFVLYARGISHERLDQWENAEADFRAALEISPDQPQVLNYLGYSLVEKKIQLEEALGMIERAVAARPDSGYIVDSLGWVLYRLGRYEESVVHMERAAELLPVDPVVNDHLGDVLWAVGRLTEARFHWSRALSFVTGSEYPEDEIKPARIRRKLEVGLDAVLAEEGAAPLKVADDNG